MNQHRPYRPPQGGKPPGKPPASRAAKPPKSPAKAAKPKGPAKTPKKSVRAGRTASARDARSRARGRLPIGAAIDTRWDGEKWAASLRLLSSGGGCAVALVKRFDVTALGVFEALERLDVAFWEWYAGPTEPQLKAALRFAESPPAPAGGVTASLTASSPSPPPTPAGPSPA